MATMLARLFAKSAPIISQALETEFNRRLHAGTLPPNSFYDFLRQDALYLPKFSAALTLISNRITDHTHALLLKQLADEMIRAEQNMQKRYLRHLHRSHFFSIPHLPTQEIPIISAYTKHLLDTAQTAPIPAAIAGCIPCFLIYYLLGKKMAGHCLEKHPYGLWIASYSSPKFMASTNKIIAIFNDLTPIVTCPQIEEQSHFTFSQSAIYEKDFFTEILTRSHSHGNQSAGLGLANGPALSNLPRYHSC